jgi:predicted MFS family arabinose efflux permease
VVGCLAGSAALLAAFVVSQFVQKNAMFEVSLFRKPTFGGAGIAAFAMSASMFAMFLYLTIYLQTILGFSPLQTGLRFLPVTVLSFFVAAISGNLSARVPVRFLMGLGLVAVGVGLLLMTGLDAASKWTALLPGFIIAGAGIGLVNPALASTAIGVVPPQRAGMASGINSTFRQVGIATGIAVLGSIFETNLRSHLTSKLAGTPGASHAAQIAHAVSGGGAQQVASAIPAAQRHTAVAAIHASFASAMNDILTVAGVVALVGAVFTVALVRGKDFVASSTPLRVSPDGETSRAAA